MRSGEYDLIAPAAVGEHITWERSAPCMMPLSTKLSSYTMTSKRTIRSADMDAKKGAPV